MKKLIAIAFAVILLGIFFSSCKTHERCPAYGKIEKAKSEMPS